MYDQVIFCDKLSENSSSVFDAIDRLSDIRDLLNEAYRYTSRCVIVCDDSDDNIIIVPHSIDRKIEYLRNKIYILEGALHDVIERGLNRHAP